MLGGLQGSGENNENLSCIQTPLGCSSRPLVGTDPCPVSSYLGLKPNSVVNIKYFCTNIQLIFFQVKLISCWEYIWLSNNVGLRGPTNMWIFSPINTISLHDLRVVESADMNHRYRRPTMGLEHLWILSIAGLGTTSQIVQVQLYFIVLFKN